MSKIKTPVTIELYKASDPYEYFLEDADGSELAVIHRGDVAKRIKDCLNACEDINPDAVKKALDWACEQMQETVGCPTANCPEVACPIGDALRKAREGTGE